MGGSWCHMSDRNEFWTLTTILFQRRLGISSGSWWLKPEGYFPEVKITKRTSIEYAQQPGSFVRYESPYRPSPMVAAMKILGDSKRIDDKYLKGLNNEDKDELAIQAEKAFEECQEGTKADERSLGEGVSRLQSLYPTHVEAGYLRENETKRLNKNLIPPTPENGVDDERDEDNV